jgi:hypothetical protein
MTNTNANTRTGPPDLNSNNNNVGQLEGNSVNKCCVLCSGYQDRNKLAISDGEGEGRRTKSVLIAKGRIQ